MRKDQASWGAADGLTAEEMRLVGEHYDALLADQPAPAHVPANLIERFRAATPLPDNSTALKAAPARTRRENLWPAPSVPNLAEERARRESPPRLTLAPPNRPGLTMGCSEVLKDAIEERLTAINIRNGATCDDLIIRANRYCDWWKIAARRGHVNSAANSLCHLISKL